MRRTATLPIHRTNTVRSSSPRMHYMWKDAVGPLPDEQHGPPAFQ